MPNGEAQTISNNLLKNNVLIDLAADFRLKNKSEYLKWYKQKHKAIKNIKKSIYSLPEINKKSLKKLISAPSFRLKGSGWYETDFKTGKKKNISSNESSKRDKSTETSKTNSKKASKQDKIKD